jgi:16S rRNA processing protein RimM
MEIKGHYYLGRILKPLGNQGAMLIYLDVDDPGQYKNLDAVFVFVGGNLVPFFIQALQLRPGKQAQVIFHDIDSVDQTEVLIGTGLYLPVTALPKLGENQFYFHEVPGYVIIDEAFGEIGIVEKVLEYPKQALLQVMHGDKEILIPIADEIIIKVDKENRIMHIKAPEGLIEMYLE